MLFTKLILILFNLPANFITTFAISPKIIIALVIVSSAIHEEKSRVIYCRLNKLDEFIDMLNGFDKDQLCCLDEVRSEDSKNTLWVNKFQYE